MRRRLAVVAAVVLGIVGSGAAGIVIGSSSSAAIPSTPQGDLTGDGTVDSYAFVPVGQECRLSIHTNDAAGTFAHKSFSLPIEPGDRNPCPDEQFVENVRGDGSWEVIWSDSGYSDGAIYGAQRVGNKFVITSGSVTPFPGPVFEDTDGDGRVDYVWATAGNSGAGRASLIDPDGSFRGPYDVATYTPSFFTSLSRTPIHFGDAVSLGVVLSDDGGGPGERPTGNVDVLIDGKPAGVLPATEDAFPLPLLDPGLHRITAHYEGDRFWLPADRTVSLTVLETSTMVRMIPSTFSPVFGQSFPVGVVVDGNNYGSDATKPQGRAQLYVDNAPRGSAVPVTNGQATVQVPGDLSVGGHQIRVQFIAGHYPGWQYSSSPSQGITVRRTGTGIGISVQPEPAVVHVGQTVKILTKVGTLAPGAGTPTGSVVITAGTSIRTVPLNNGTAGITTTFGAVGTVRIVVVYPGDHNHLPSAKATVLQVKK
jgi:hypothetical protein